MLDAKKITGPKAGVIKYDILTALSIWGMAGSQTNQISMLRLTTLLTARYNWRKDQLTVGQRDIAKIWSVNERTVKREMKRLTDLQFLMKTRAGVKGRVGAYCLNYAQIWAQTEPMWNNAGPDFVERMRALAPREKLKVVQVDFENRVQIPTERSGVWRDVARQLNQRDPNLYANWFSHLEFLSLEDGCIRLKAPSAFVGRYVETHLQKQLFETAQSVFPNVQRMVIVT